jgi:hypothetical protein
MAFTATRHVDAGGSNTSPYDTWAKAATSLVTAVTGAAAGDVIVMGSDYTETITSALTIGPGTSNTNPYAVMCGTKATTAGLSDLTPGAVITVSTGGITLNGSGYYSGITFIMSQAASLALSLAATNACAMRFDNCSFQISGGGSGSVLDIGSYTAGGGSSSVLKNCTFKFSYAGQKVSIMGGNVRIIGGSILSGGTSPTAFCGLDSSNRGATEFRVSEGFSLANCSAGVNLVTAGSMRSVFSDIVLPTSWSGTPVATPAVGQAVELYQSYANTTLYRTYITRYTVTIRDDTSIYVTSGLVDGTTPYSYKLVTTANVSYPNNVAYGQTMEVGNSTVGSQITVTVPIIHDSVTALTNEQVYLQVGYLDTANGVLVDDAPATVITTASAQTTSTADWAGSGYSNMTNPNKQELSVSFTPNQVGALICRVCMTAASKTLYHDKPYVS